MILFFCCLGWHVDYLCLSKDLSFKVYQTSILIHFLYRWYLIFSLWCHTFNISNFLQESYNFYILYELIIEFDRNRPVTIYTSYNYSDFDEENNKKPDVNIGTPGHFKTAFLSNIQYLLSEFQSVWNLLYFNKLMLQFDAIRSVIMLQNTSVSFIYAYIPALQLWCFRYGKEPQLTLPKWWISVHLASIWKGNNSESCFLLLLQIFVKNDTFLTII